ncbi:MAG TPA: phage terminase small subunit P27 family, partial [Firmicutes bacterium]|nr:phage terminase small subunit P27 family [Bacillota bacterium]
MNRKPTALKILEGNPGKRPLPQNEPKPEPVAPKCPSRLPAAAKRHWKALAPKLEKLGLLTEVDGQAFADYCLCLARLEEAEKDIEERGLLVEGDRGKVKNPAAQLAREYRAALQKWAARFGLDPQSRAGLDIPKADDEDELEQFLKAGR